MPKTNERDSASEFPDASSTFGKYRLLEKIGKGGMAEVFLARPRGQRRLVAIKVMLEELASKKQYVDMFIQEGKLAIELNHDAIVKTYEVGRVHGRHFICMEYIPGADLLQVLKECRQPGARLPVPHALYIGLRICEGLHYAHQLTDRSGNSLNLVNRDVSQSNVRISYDGEVKLLDFGIAKATSSMTSEIGVLKGKLSHMSPEQVRGIPLDRRSDVFSAGIVIHEMLTLEKLFRGTSEFQKMDLVRQAKVHPPSATNSRIHEEVDALVLRSLEKKPHDRFQTAEEMAQTIRGALERYNFSREELRGLMRDLFIERIQDEQVKVQQYLQTNTIVEPIPAVTDEDYGVFMVVDDDDVLHEDAASAVASITPNWIWILLAAAVALLSLAMALLFLL